MAITEEQQRIRKTSHVERVDRLSDLPDSIICSILSFLPTKSSVATTVLAKRWRFLWADVPNLDFDCRENQDIINRVLLQTRARTLTTFRFNYKTRCSAYQLETWINFATVRNVQKLDIYLRHQYYHYYYSHRVDLLPQCLFTCKTLVDLRLNSCGIIPVSVAFSLPRLKKLHLLFLKYEDDDSLPHLLSGCPVLEELDLQLERDMVYCNVSSPTVKRLTLNFNKGRHGGRVQRLDINTPALGYLKINDTFSYHSNIKCGVLTSIFEADITLDSDFEILHSRSLRGFLDNLCKLKCLKLAINNCTQIIDSIPSDWTISFRNLTQLELSADCRILSKFLQNANNLEILIFRKLCRHSVKCCEEIEGWMEPQPQQVPTCLLSHLRIVKFAYFEGKPHQFQIIRYLLKNARVLERMEIACHDSNAKVDILEKLLLFQRGSPSCEVALVLGL